MVGGGIRRWKNVVLPCWGSLLLLEVRKAEARDGQPRKRVIELVSKFWWARTTSSSDFPIAACTIIGRQKTFLMNK